MRNVAGTGGFKVILRGRPNHGRHNHPQHEPSLQPSGRRHHRGHRPSRSWPCHWPFSGDSDYGKSLQGHSSPAKGSLTLRFHLALRQCRYKRRISQLATVVTGTSRRSTLGPGYSWTIQSCLILKVPLSKRRWSASPGNEGSGGSRAGSWTRRSKRT